MNIKDYIPEITGTSAGALGGGLFTRYGLGVKDWKRITAGAGVGAGIGFGGSQLYRKLAEIPAAVPPSSTEASSPEQAASSSPAPAEVLPKDTGIKANGEYIGPNLHELNRREAINGLRNLKNNNGVPRRIYSNNDISKMLADYEAGLDVRKRVGMSPEKAADHMVTRPERRGLGGDTTFGKPTKASYDAISGMNGAMAGMMDIKGLNPESFNPLDEGQSTYMYGENTPQRVANLMMLPFAKEMGAGVRMFQRFGDTVTGGKQPEFKVAPGSATSDLALSGGVPAVSVALPVARNASPWISKLLPESVKRLPEVLRNTPGIARLMPVVDKVSPMASKFISATSGPLAMAGKGVSVLANGMAAAQGVVDRNKIEDISDYTQLLPGQPGYTEAVRRADLSNVGYHAAGSAMDVASAATRGSSPSMGATMYNYAKAIAQNDWKDSAATNRLTNEYMSPLLIGGGLDTSTLDLSKYRQLNRAALTGKGAYAALLQAKAAGVPTAARPGWVMRYK